MMFYKMNNFNKVKFIKMESENYLVPPNSSEQKFKESKIRHPLDQRDGENKNDKIIENIKEDDYKIDNNYEKDKGNQNNLSSGKIEFI